MANIDKKRRGGEFIGQKKERGSLLELIIRTIFKNDLLKIN